MAVLLYLILRMPEWLPGSNQYLFFNQVNTGNHFSYGMFNLYTGVHFKEKEIQVLVDQKFDGACTAVTDGCCKINSSFAYFFTYGGCEGGRGGFLHNFLVAPLYAAFTFKKMDSISFAIAEHLYFNMPGFFHKAFNVNRPVTKIRGSFTTCRFKQRWKFAGIPYNAHPFSTTAGSSFYQHRVGESGSF